MYNKNTMRKKTIRLTESELINLVKKVIKEQESSEISNFEKCLSKLKELGFTSSTDKGSKNCGSILYFNDEIKKHFSIGACVESRWGGYIIISSNHDEPKLNDPNSKKILLLTKSINNLIYQWAKKSRATVNKDVGKNTYQFSLNDCDKLILFLKELKSSFETKFPEYSRLS